MKEVIEEDISYDLVWAGNHVACYKDFFQLIQWNSRDL